MSSLCTGHRPKKSISTNRQQPPRAVKRPRIEPTVAAQFPPEIWEYIFRYVPSWQLPQLRLICRHWNDVISGSPSLMNRIDVRIEASGGTHRMDRNYVPANLPSLLTSMLVRKFTIVSCDHWWPDCAKKLKELQLMYCRMTFDVLYGMLRQAPNLRRLVLYGVKLSGHGVPNFQLEGLESLVLCFVDYEDKSRNFLDGFEHVFSRLEDLSLDTTVIPSNLLQSIRTLQNTLQYLTLSRHPNVLTELCEMKQLRLKMLSLDVNLQDNQELWTRFCGNQPLLENLSVLSNCSQVLLETGRMLPKLKILTLNIRSRMVASFLEAMPGLEYLEISGCYELFSFRNFTCPNLERFVLEVVETEDLFQFLQRSPKLRQMRLNDCKLGYRETISYYFPNLTLLVLDDLSCHPHIWFSLLSHLQELQLVYLKYLDDDIMRKICMMLKRLKKLTLTTMRYLTDQSATHIIRHCRALEELDVDFSFSDAALDRIEAVRKIRVKRARVRSDDEDEEGY